MCSVLLPSTRATFRGTAVSGLRYTIEKDLKRKGKCVAGMWLCKELFYICLACSALNFAVLVFVVLFLLYDLLNSLESIFVLLTH